MMKGRETVCDVHRLGSIGKQGRRRRKGVVNRRKKGMRLLARSYSFRRLKWRVKKENWKGR